MTAENDTPVYGRIYCVTNAVNGKQYIGQTTQLMAERWRQHCYAGRTQCRALQNAIRKYGIDAFSMQEICTADSQSELDQLEKSHIADRETIAPRGYNLKGGGNGGRVHEETKRRLSEAFTPERVSRFNEMKRTPEVRAKHAEAMREATTRVFASLTPERRAAWRAAIGVGVRTGKKKTFKQTPEARAARTEARKKSWTEEMRGKRSKTIMANRATHCKRGHEFSPANIMWRGNWRCCLTCRKASRDKANKKQALRGRVRGMNEIDLSGNLF